jgi:hypothetical protein
MGRPGAAAIELNAGGGKHLSESSGVGILPHGTQFPSENLKEVSAPDDTTTFKKELPVPLELTGEECWIPGDTAYTVEVYRQKELCA